MTIIRTKLRKMTDAKVNFVSLVGRASSRIPFRIMKSADEENQMIDLNSLKSVFTKKTDKKVPASKDKQPAEILSVVVDKAQAEQLKTAITEAGFSVDNVKEHEDGALEFIQKEQAEGDEVQVIRLSDRVAVVAKGFAPWQAGMTNFNDVVKTQGFQAGLCMGSEALRSVINGAMEKADTAADAQTIIDKALKDFSAYVGGLVGGLPNDAFSMVRKTDAVELNVEESADESTSSEEQTETETPVAPTAESVTETPAEAAAQVAVETNAEAVQKSSSEGNVGAMLDEKIAKAFEGLTNVLKTELGTITTNVDQLARQVSEVVSCNEQLGKTLSDVVQKTEKLGSTVQSTVLASSPADEPAPATKDKIVKSDSRTGTFDTAYLPK